MKARNYCPLCRLWLQDKQWLYYRKEQLGPSKELLCKNQYAFEGGGKEGLIEVGAGFGGVRSWSGYGDFGSGAPFASLKWGSNHMAWEAKMFRAKIYSNYEVKRAQSRKIKVSQSMCMEYKTNMSINSVTSDERQASSNGGMPAARSCIYIIVEGKRLMRLMVYFILASHVSRL